MPTSMCIYVSVHLLYISVSQLFFSLSPLLRRLFRHFFPSWTPHEKLIPQIYCLSVYVLCVYLCFIYKQSKIFHPSRTNFIPLGEILPPLRMRGLYVHLCTRANTHTHMHTTSQLASWVLGERPAKHVELLEKRLPTNHSQTREQLWSSGSCRKQTPAIRKPGNSSQFWSSLGMTWFPDLQSLDRFDRPHKQKTSNCL